jgi:mono/diheme cytochrome c family protein
MQLHLRDNFKTTKSMKIVLRIALGLLVLVAGLALYIQLGYHKKFDETPYPTTKATKDPEMIAHGKYLVYGPAHCANCHVDKGQEAEVEAGKELPLIGGFELNIGPGIFRARNLTSDKETGIGALSDGEIARTMRYNVNHQGEAIVPFMPFQQMSEYDMTCIISYLRTLPPVKHKVEPSEYNFLGKFVKTFIFKPSLPTEPIADRIDADTTPEYGKYLAHSVANCYGCHTDRNLKTGEFIGEPFGGGFVMSPSPETKGYGFVTPNITIDETGKLNGWTEQTFVARMKQGRVHAASPMPWGPFSRMNETDMKAVYRYLQTVTPVKKTIAKSVYAPNEIELMPKPKG